MIENVKIIIVRGLAVLAVPAALLAAPAGPGPKGEPAPAVDEAAWRSAFGKETPEGKDDLVAMQLRFRTLIDRLAPTTVTIFDAAGLKGSGVVISTEGYALTAAHVAGKPGDALTVVLPDGRRLKAAVLETDRVVDLALVRIAGGGKLPSAPLGRSGGLARGQWCMALGYSRDLAPPDQPVARVGRLQAKVSSMIRTDCLIEGSDSGGALFDMDGRVVGIHTCITGSTASPDTNGHTAIDSCPAAWTRLVEAAGAATIPVPPCKP